MMISSMWVAFGAELCRLLNNLLESEPVEIRRARAVAWFEISKPLWWWMVPADKREVIEGLVDEIGRPESRTTPQ